MSSPPDSYSTQKPALLVFCWCMQKCQRQLLFVTSQLWLVHWQGFLTTNYSFTPSEASAHQYVIMPPNQAWQETEYTRNCLTYHHMVLWLTRAESPTCVTSLSSIPAPCEHWGCQLGTKVKSQWTCSYQLNWVWGSKGVRRTSKHNGQSFSTWVPCHSSNDATNPVMCVCVCVEGVPYVFTPNICNTVSEQHLNRC